MNSDPTNELDALKSIFEMASGKKSGRGRPRKHSHEVYEIFESLRAKTTRGKQNYLYAGRARSVLVLGKDQFAYLLTPKFRTTILSEIGRINDPRVILSVAAEICATRMKTAKAVGLCRRMRGVSKPSISELAAAIRRAVKAYRERHPNVSEADVTTALRMAAYE